MSKGIPSVRTWKVTSVDTGLVIYVDTINKDFARWIARTERGMGNQDLKVSVVKDNKATYKDYGSSRKEAKALQNVFGDPGLRDC